MTTIAILLMVCASVAMFHAGERMECGRRLPLGHGHSDAAACIALSVAAVVLGVAAIVVMP